MRQRIRSSSKLRLTIVALVAIAVLAIGGVSLAALTARQAESLVVDFSVTAVSPPTHKQCQGPDGLYLNSHGSYSGSVSSLSKFFTGTMNLTLDSSINLDKDLGTATGIWAVVDPDTQRQKASGKLDGIFPTRLELHPFFAGQARDGRRFRGEAVAFTDDAQSEFVGRIGRLTPKNEAVLVPMVSC
jgi:hypothetical protein